MAIVAWPFEPKRLVTPYEYRYFSRRYFKWITVPQGFHYDGATCAPNVGLSFIFHDWLFAYGRFDNGTPIKWREANLVMSDIMSDENVPRWVRNIYRRGINSHHSYKAWLKHRENDLQHGRVRPIPAP